LYDVGLHVNKKKIVKDQLAKKLNKSYFVGSGPQLENKMVQK